MTSPKISVVIPTYNRVDQLRIVLDALERQHLADSDAEVVVVSDGSTDDTNELLRTHRSRFRFRWIPQPNGGPAVARNTGLHAAAAPVVLFLDDDVVPEPDLLRAHLAVHARSDGRTVVVGPMLTPRDVTLQPWVAWEQAMLERQYDAMTSGQWSATARQFYTGNASLDREAALRVGGFDPAFRRAEDVEFAYRLDGAGFRFTFEPAARGFHYAARSYRSWIEIAEAYGRNNVVFARDGGHDWLISASREDWAAHHVLLRSIVAICVRSPWLFRPTAALFGGAGRTLGAVRLQRLSRAGFSVAYSLAYYRAMDAELQPDLDVRRFLTGRTIQPGAVPHVGFVLEQSLGHVTHAANLHELIPRTAALDPLFADLPFEPTSWMARVPGVRSNWTIRAGLLARLALRSMHRDQPLDAVFVHTQVPAVLSSSWLRRVPGIVSVDATPEQYDELGDSYGHEIGPRWLERLKHRANRLAFRRAAMVVAWSRWAASGVIDGYGIDPARLVVVPPGVDPDRWARPSPREAGDTVRILFVGGDLARKGGDVLLRAFRDVAARPGARRVELHLVTKSTVAPEPGVVVHDSMTPNSSALIELYHACDVFALPTRGDCLPMVLSEAGAASMPLIATDVGAISEIVRDGETGVLLAVDDEAGLRDALARLVDDAELRAAMGARAEALVRAEFDAAKNAARLVELLTSIARVKR